MKETLSKIESIGTPKASGMARGKHFGFVFGDKH